MPDSQAGWGSVRWPGEDRRQWWEQSVLSHQLSKDVAPKFLVKIKLNSFSRAWIFKRILNAEWAGEPSIETTWSGSPTRPWRCASQSITDAVAPHKHSLLLPSKSWVSHLYLTGRDRSNSCTLEPREATTLDGGLNLGISLNLERPFKGCRMVTDMESTLCCHRFPMGMLTSHLEGFLLGQRVPGT